MAAMETEDTRTVEETVAAMGMAMATVRLRRTGLRGVTTHHPTEDHLRHLPHTTRHPEGEETNLSQNTTAIGRTPAVRESESRSAT